MKDEAEDQSVLKVIQQLAAEEHRLYEHEALTNADRARLAKINIELDQCWDLLRQRQALRDTGRDPDQARRKFQPAFEEDRIDVGPPETIHAPTSERHKAWLMWPCSFDSRQNFGREPELESFLRRGLCWSNRSRQLSSGSRRRSHVGRKNSAGTTSASVSPTGSPWCTPVDRASP